MREIKFRAWNKFEEEFLTEPWSLTCDNFRRPESLIHIGYGKFMEAKHFVFEQYTGLKDKDGVEIYEGDILSVRNWGCTDVEILKSQVFWCEDEKGWRHEGDIDAYDQFRKVYVIGNIHQNPELLGGEG